jgi:polyisoprenyl-teichoic acid--peptidoglycan teichoic acid transferase
VTINDMDQIYNGTPQPKPTGNRKLIWFGVIVGVGIIAIILAYTVYSGVSKFISGWQLTDLPGIVVSSDSTPTPEISGTQSPGALPPAPLNNGPEPVPWDGASRVNVLVMGLDYRDWLAGEGAPRTDTMILLSIDPISKTAGILSIPRDLWVTIPGFDEPNRINVAYRFGETYQLPGGGPELAMKTVEGLLGLPIDYYALIDFQSFEKFIDEIGGVDLTVPKKVRVDPIDGDVVILWKGKHHLDGKTALAYARARNTSGGDFDRAKRQQQVIMAMRDKILSADILPTLIGRASAIYQDLSKGIQTNLGLDQTIQLAWLAQSIPDESIKRGAIGKEHITFGKSPEGDDVLKPRPEQVRILRDEIFTSTGVTNPALANEDLKSLVAQENASVSIMNGAQTPGLASRTTDYLTADGINVTSTGDAPEPYGATTIISYKGNPYTLKYLVEKLAINPNKIYVRYDPNSQVDFVIYLGYDWANTNQMP